MESNELVKPPYGSCGIHHFQYAEGYRGLAQRWEKGINIVRTTQYFSPQRGGWYQGLYHNEETIIVKKQIQFMGRCQS